MPTWIAKGRSREMTALRFRLGKEMLSEYEGPDVEVLCTERGKGSGTIARDDRYIRVVIAETVELRVTARVTGAKGTHLMARVVA